MDIKIRPADTKDLPVILFIMNDAILNSTAIYDYHPRTMSLVEKWYEQKLQAGWPVLVCVWNNETVGYASFGTFRAWDAYQYTVEHSIYVHPKWRGKGVGKMLIEHLIAAAKSGGYHTMLGGIDAANTASCLFHQSFGFVESGRIKDAGYKFNRWLDLVFMQLMLK